MNSPLRLWKSGTTPSVHAAHYASEQTNKWLNEITCVSSCSLASSSRFRILNSSSPWTSSWPDLLDSKDVTDPCRCLIPGNPEGGRPQSEAPEYRRLRVRPRDSAVIEEHVDMASKLCRSVKILQFHFFIDFYPKTINIVYILKSLFWHQQKNSKKSLAHF